MKQRGWEISVLWKAPHMIRLRVHEKHTDTTEEIALSRLQIGLLWAFTLASEVTRAEAYEYLSKIWGEPIETPIPARYRRAMSRIITLLVEHGLIVQVKKVLYRTMKGQAVVDALFTTAVPELKWREDHVSER